MAPAHAVVDVDFDSLSDWLGAMDEAHNVFDQTDEATTVITINVEELALRLVAALAQAGDAEQAGWLSEALETLCAAPGYTDAGAPVVAVDDLRDALLAARAASVPATDTAPFEFRGKDRWAVAHTGVQSGDVAAFVERKYEARWQSLTVSQDGVEVGGIQRADDGHLTWWAEGPPAADHAADGASAVRALATIRRAVADLDARVHGPHHFIAAVRAATAEGHDTSDDNGQ